MSDKIMRTNVLILCLVCGMTVNLSAQPFCGEKLARSMVGIPVEQGMYLSWRMFISDAENMPFDIFRITDGGKQIKVNARPILKTSDFRDTTVDLSCRNTWVLKSRGSRTGSFLF